MLPSIPHLLIVSTPTSSLPSPVAMPQERWTSSYANGRDSDRRQWSGSHTSHGGAWPRNGDGERDRGRDRRDGTRPQQPSHPPSQHSADVSATNQPSSSSQPSAPAPSSTATATAIATASASSTSPASSLLGKRVGSIPFSQLAQVAKRKATESDTQPIKPVFLTRRQREELALQRAEEERKEREEERAKREQSTQQLIQAQQQTAPPSNPNARLNDRERDREKDRDGHRGDSRQWRDRDSGRDRDSHRDRDRGRDTRHSATARSPEEDLKERELALIRAQHLGQRLDTTKPAKPDKDSRTKYRFNFDWEAADDTSADPYALYEKRQESSLLYGRGFVGGVDRSQQRRKHEELEERARERLQHTKAEEKKDESDEVDTSKAKMETEDGRVKHEASSSDDRLALASGRDKRADKETLVMQRQRHWSEKSLHEMEERDWRIFKEDFEINTRGHRIPHPLRSWKESILPPVILHALAKAGYEKPSPIQRAAIPVGLINRDVIGIAETGSGKTVAFLLPMLVYISRLPPITTATAEAGPYALIMAPTRELAQQISDECNKIGREMGIRNVCIVGGLAIEEQGAKLRDGAEVVIGTPGRLIDCVEKRYLVLDQCNYVVLDEADRMIDMNFEPQIVRVMDAMPSSNLRPETDPDDEKATAASDLTEDGSSGMEVERTQRYRQTIMFSATMAPKVMLLAKKYLRSPVEIAVGDRRGKASSNVEQRVEWVKTDTDKKRRLQELLSNEQPPFIIFCNLKRTCDQVQGIVSGCGLRSDVLHGSKTQEVRQRTLQQFKDGQLQVLIATDVMARGIDIDDIRHVVNYEMPADIQSYTHRIGRTGRAGKKGVATSYVSDKDADILYDLKTMLKDVGQAVPHEVAMHPAARTKPTGLPGDAAGQGRGGKVQHAE